MGQASSTQMTNNQPAASHQVQPSTSHHVKSNNSVVTPDGWRLHLVRTQQSAGNGKDPGTHRTYPVILIPGLCSSGAYTFDLSPAVSLADFLADQGWDVWTAELRGNGQSDKPSLFSNRSHWWTIDDMIDNDLPTIVNHVCMATGCSAAHCMGHSMGGMILTASLARKDATSAKMRSVTLIGSSCFLEGSWWQRIQGPMGAVRVLHTVPAGTIMRLYSNLSFTRLGIKYMDVLYFWPTNVDPALARACLARNFSATSPGVILQFQGAFNPRGLKSATPGHAPFATHESLGSVNTPVFMICGDKDKMCPPWGAVRQFDMFGGPDKKLAVLGPKTGYTTHYGHFDILMGKHALQEVFPQLHSWLQSHDGCSVVASCNTMTSTNAESVTMEGVDAPAMMGRVHHHLQTMHAPVYTHHQQQKQLEQEQHVRRAGTFPINVPPLPPPPPAATLISQPASAALPGAIGSAIVFDPQAQHAQRKRTLHDSFSMAVTSAAKVPHAIAEAAGHMLCGCGALHAGNAPICAMCQSDPSFRAVYSTHQRSTLGGDCEVLCEHGPVRSAGSTFMTCIESVDRCVSPSVENMDADEQGFNSCSSIASDSAVDNRSKRHVDGIPVGNSSLPGECWADGGLAMQHTRAALPDAKSMHSCHGAGTPTGTASTACVRPASRAEIFVDPDATLLSVMLEQQQLLQQITRSTNAALPSQPSDTAQSSRAVHAEDPFNWNAEDRGCKSGALLEAASLPNSDDEWSLRMDFTTRHHGVNTRRHRKHRGSMDGRSTQHGRRNSGRSQYQQTQHDKHEEGVLRMLTQQPAAGGVVGGDFPRIAPLQLNIRSRL